MSWDFFRTETRSAAKPHACAECRKAIEVGERHSYCAGKVEGMFEDYRLCLLCQAYVSAWWEVIGDSDEGFPMGDVRTELREHTGRADLDVWLAEHQAKMAQAAADRRVRQARADRIARTILIVVNAELQSYRLLDQIARRPGRSA